MSRRCLIMLFVAVCLVPGAIAQVTEPDDIPDVGPGGGPAAVEWKGPTWDLIAGLNLGLRKFLLVVHMQENARPFCDLLFRVNDRENLQKEIMKSYVPPERLAYFGRHELEADGNSWTEYRFRNVQGTEITVCTPVRALGPKLVERFKAMRFDFDAKHLPHVLVLANDGRANLAFPLRDMKLFDNPHRALMDDVVPFEPSADRLAVVSFLVERIAGADPSQQPALLERLERFTTLELDSAASMILGLRDQGTNEAKAIAKRICMRHGLYSDGDVMQACTDLESPESKVVHAACIKLRDMGYKARGRAAEPIAKLLARTDLPADTRVVAEAASQRFATPPTPESRPASRPASLPER